MNAIRIDPRPDFNRFRDVLLLKKTVRRPPIFDFHVAPEHKARVLGRPMVSPADDVEFWRLAGYDYVHCVVAVPWQEILDLKGKPKGGTGTHGSEQGLITSPTDYYGRRWSWQAVAEGDLSPLAHRFEWLRGVCAALPPGMKAMAHCADVFTWAWELMGFSNFCLASMEEPKLVKDLMDGLAAAQVNLMREAARVAGKDLGLVMYSDDIAYSEGLMLKPGFFIERLSPLLAEMADIGRNHGAPFLYHTDGRLYDLFDEFARLGIHAIQPLEPKAMDPLEIQRRWPGKFCLCGNIDLDLMARGTPDEVERHVREKIDRLNTRGGYMPGVSNTVPFYVKFENYARMIETVYSYA